MKRKKAGRFDSTTKSTTRKGVSTYLQWDASGADVHSEERIVMLRHAAEDWFYGLDVSVRAGNHTPLVVPVADEAITEGIGGGMHGGIINEIFARGGPTPVIGGGFGGIGVFLNHHEFHRRIFDLRCFEREVGIGAKAGVSGKKGSYPAVLIAIVETVHGVAEHIAWRRRIWGLAGEDIPVPGAAEQISVKSSQINAKRRLIEILPRRVGNPNVRGIPIDPVFVHGNSGGA